MPSTKNIIKKIQMLDSKYETWRVFSDFCEMVAITISNSFDKTDFRFAQNAAVKPPCICSGRPDDFVSFGFLSGASLILTIHFVTSMCLIRIMELFPHRIDPSPCNLYILLVQFYTDVIKP